MGGGELVCVAEDDDGEAGNEGRNCQGSSRAVLNRRKAGRSTGVARPLRLSPVALDAVRMGRRLQEASSRLSNRVVAAMLSEREPTIERKAGGQTGSS